MANIKLDILSLEEITKGAKEGKHDCQNELGNRYWNGNGVEQDYKQAVYWFEKAAELDNAIAQSKLGVCYKNGEGVTQNYEQAIHWFTKAAEQGNPQGQFNLGSCFYHGDGVEKDYKKAFVLFKKAAEHEDDEAQNSLGLCYYNGDGVEQNYEKAVYWYTKANELGNAKAKNNLGLCYYNGNGVNKDLVIAIWLYKRSSELGCADAQNNLASCYYNGEGVNQNYEIAFDLYTKAAELGNANAQNYLGTCYYLGNGTTQDYQKAINWWKKSAELGNASAQSNLATCYYYGKGVEKDYEKAVYWWEKAAELKDSDAQYNLSTCYQKGEGVEENLEKAAHYCKLSAELGNVNAQRKLGEYYFSGKGVERDYEKAVYWWEKAAEFNDSDAQCNLGNCYYNGYGVKQDYKKAFDLFNQANEQQNPTALCYIGVCYFYGRGVEKNLEKAVEFYQRSAKQGYVEAEYNLGICYFYGYGVEKNLQKAVEYYQLSANQGIDKAQYNLALCYEMGYGVEKDYKQALNWYTKSAELGNADAQYNLGVSYFYGEGTKKDYKKAVACWTNAAKNDSSKSMMALGICYFDGLVVKKDYQEALYWLRKALENGEEEAREICLEIEKELSNQESIYPDLHAKKRKDIFISWNQFDEKIKDSIVDTLEKNIITCWHSDENCNGDIEKACFSALDNALSYLFIISKNSLKSEWVKKELMHVIDKVKKGIILKNFVKPVFIDDVYQDIKKLKEDGEIDNPFVILVDLEIASTTVNSKNINLGNIYENVKMMIIDYHKKDYVNKLYNSFNTFNYFLTIQTTTNDSTSSKVIPTRIDYELGYIKRKLEDEKGNITNINEVLKNDVSLIYGEGGSGKSLLISEIVRSNKDSLFFVTKYKDVCKYFEKNKQQPFYEYLKTLYIKQISDKETTDDLLVKESFDNLLPAPTHVTPNKKYYIIFDSIDELDNDGDCNLINEKIKDFTESHSYFKYIYTSRNKDDVHKINFTSNVNVYKLKELTEDDINSLIENIFNYINKKTEKISQEKITEFIETLKRVPNNIKKNPLLLTNLIVNYIKEGKILTKKYEIIDNSLKILINDLEKERNIRFKYDDVLDKSGKILEELSFQKYVDGDEETLETLERIFDSLDIVNYEAKAEEYLIYLKRRGIYTNNTFMHLSYQESLAAKYCYKLLYKMEKDELQRYRLCFSKSSSGDTLLHLYTLEYFKEEEWSGPTKALIAQIDNHCKDENLKILEETIDIIKDEIPERTIEDIKEDVESDAYYNKEIIKNLYNKI